MWIRKLVLFDLVRIDGFKFELLGILFMEVCKILCVIMVFFEIFDILDECYFGFVVFFVFVGYNLRNSIFYGKEFDIEVFVICF